MGGIPVRRRSRAADMHPAAGEAQRGIRRQCAQIAQAARAPVSLEHTRCRSLALTSPSYLSKQLVAGSIAKRHRCVVELSGTAPGSPVRCSSADPTLLTVSRPFRAVPIKGLETLVAERGQDRTILELVGEELAHRTTARAQRLRDQVESLLTGTPAAADIVGAYAGRPRHDADVEQQPVKRGEAPVPPPRAPNRRSRTPAPPAPIERGRWAVDGTSLQEFQSALESSPASAEWFELRRAAERLSLSPGFDTLITLNANTIKELPHQIDVAQRVLRQMGGRAILADEVGLGKTIEAGIVLKELAVRGLARRILILTPAALVDQWQGELESKFLERFDTPKDPDDWHHITRGIASYQRAINRRHAEAILHHQWDLVIIDEAHKVKNHQAATYQFLQRVRRNYMLMLTATPLQNNLRELYNLVTLLRPGQLGTWREFQRQHVGNGDLRKPTNPEALRDLTAQVMIRTRRSSVAHALELPRRIPVHPSIALSADEATLYKATVAFLRGLYTDGFVQPSAEEEAEDAARRRRRTGRGILQLELLRLCQRLCSSSHALAGSLEHLAEGELVTPEYRTRARQIAAAARRVTTHAKLDALEQVLLEHPGQVIVFSEHLPTLGLIRDRVRELGRTPVLYQGGLSREERAKRLAAFKRAPAAVFVATRAGTEGLNLQFANVLVNYELPWNPMVVEQRIGRIHRIGQERDCHIVNLAAAGTIEAHVLRLLDQKIRLFELVVGELDVILGDFGGADTLEQRLMDEYLGADSDADFERAMEAIGQEIVTSREAGLAQERLASEIAAEDNAMRLERDFQHLTIPARVRLGYGTNLLSRVRGVEAKREHLGLHVSELLEALESAHQEDAGMSPDYGALVRLTGVTGRGRAVRVDVQADRLPMLLVDVDADPEAPLATSPIWTSLQREGEQGAGAA